MLGLGMGGQNLSFGQGQALCRDASCYSDRHLLLGTSLWCSGQEESGGWVLWPERCGFASSLWVVWQVLTSDVYFFSRLSDQLPPWGLDEGWPRCVWVRDPSFHHLTPPRLLRIRVISSTPRSSPRSAFQCPANSS